MQKNIAIGVDIGGSHISCAAIDLNRHELIPGTVSEKDINNKDTAEIILSGWALALEKTLSGIDRSRLSGIGFAMPGPFDYPNGIALFERVEKFESLFGISIIDEMRKRLKLDADTRIRFINDATSFAIAESWIGKGKDYERVLALTLGTGFGSAFIDKGVPVIDGNSVPASGCVWHLPFKDGIADDYFSTRWFVRSYEAITGKKVQGVKEIADSFESDPASRELFFEYGSNMGHFLAPWVKKFNAGVIVIGGNITGSYQLYGNFLQEALLSEGANTVVSISELKESAAIIGSARLIDDQFWSKVVDLLAKM